MAKKRKIYDDEDGYSDDDDELYKWKIETKQMITDFFFILRSGSTSRAYDE